MAALFFRGARIPSNNHRQFPQTFLRVVLGCSFSSGFQLTRPRVIFQQKTHLLTHQTGTFPTFKLDSKVVVELSFKFFTSSYWYRSPGTNGFSFSPFGGFRWDLSLQLILTTKNNNHNLSSQFHGGDREDRKLAQVTTC